MTKNTLSAALLLILLSAAVDAAQTPRLVLQITVDGLRADLLQRYSHNFSKGGFRYLLEKGVVYRDAQYQHANTETIVGHATLATGAQPAVQGMVGNVWFDSQTGELAYNIEDPDHPLLATREQTRQGAQVDPAQKKSRTQGRSPLSMLVPTFADALAAGTDGQARIFGIAGKDRSAVAMAGQVGKAYWYSTNSGDFQSSSYYYDEYPAWAQRWNDERRAEQHAGGQWNLLLDRERYQPGRRDDRPYEVDLKGYGRTFPHAFGPVDHPLFATRVLVSPVGDQLLADFASALVAAEELGQDEVTDYLAVSFSAVDAVNHFFGPASLENEDVVLQLDRTLAGLLRDIDKQVGLRHTLIVLSADHGMAEMPEYMTELGYEAGRLFTSDVEAMVNTLGEQLFDVKGICKTFFRPSLYLDQEAITARGLDPDRVAIELAAALSRQTGIGMARASVELLAGEHSGVAAMMQRNTHPQRSGDIYVAQAPYWFMFDKGAIAAMHGSPWRYDTHVPIIFAGAGIVAREVFRRVHPVDVAPTLTSLLGLSPPAGSQGQILTEVYLTKVQGR
jgi:predicted AlkP superfamily pyrophosphatase or phosphodiesterase